MDGLPHVILRQTLELGVPGQEGALALQEEVRRVYDQRILPAIDRVLSSRCPGDRWVRLDHIDLDLGALPAEELEDELVTRTEARLKEILGQPLGGWLDEPDTVPDGPGLGDAPSGFHPNAAWQGDQQKRLPSRDWDSRDSEGRVIGPRAAKLRWLRAFLETGCTPWWVPKASFVDPESVLLELLEESPPEVAVLLQEVAGASVARRLVRQLSPASSRRLVALLVGPSSQPVERLLDDWQHWVGAFTTATSDDPDSSLVGDLVPALALEQALDLLAAQPAAPDSAEILARQLARMVMKTVQSQGPATARLLARQAQVLPRHSLLRARLEEEARRVTAAGRSLVEVPVEISAGEPATRQLEREDVAARQSKKSRGPTGGKTDRRLGSEVGPREQLVESAATGRRPGSEVGPREQLAEPREVPAGEITGMVRGVEENARRESKEWQQELGDDSDQSLAEPSSEPRERSKRRRRLRGGEADQRPIVTSAESQERTGRRPGISGEQPTQPAVPSAEQERARRHQGISSDEPDRPVILGAELREGVDKHWEAPIDEPERAAVRSVEPQKGVGSEPASSEERRRLERPGSRQPAVSPAERWQRFVEEPAERQLFEDPEDILFVDDAGLVLVAPFLSPFFGKLGLLEDRTFRSSRAQERAVLLARYLVTGSAEASEHLLVLDKLLCGWPVGEPVARAIEPTREEEDESAELLASILGHWQALGKTSAAGLRSSFLQREGRLTAGDQGWQLKVDRTGYDVLLDQLPWGIGLVRLPWMDQPISVEW